MRERRAGCRHRNSIRLRPRPYKPAFARSRLLDRRRHAVPRRDDERVRDRHDVALCAGPRGRAPWPKRPSPMSTLRVPNIENRFRYNQAFKSVFAMVPSVIVMMLVLIPAIMATIAVVREKETGSIANFRSTPISKFEFLMGKQFPYVVVGMLTFVLLLLMAFFVFHVPVKGSFGALALGTLALRFLDLRFRAARLDLHPDPGRGSLCDHGSLHHPHSEFFRSARARVLAHRPGKADWPDVSSGLVSADQRRHLHQGTGLFRSLVQCARPCGLRGRLSSLPLIYCCGSRRADMSATEPDGRRTENRRRRRQ